MANAIELLPANLQNTLNQIVDRVNKANGGINVILLSTAEGVPLGRVYADRSAQLNEEVLASIESTWAPASKQFSLLDLGKEAKVVTAIYDHGTILHVYEAPVVVTILVAQNANLGAVRSTAIPLLKEALLPLCTTLLNSLAPQEADPSYPAQAYYQ
ncbi:unnamed protein product [Cylindrotheca closterium]|uniref:Uncharacterized protein n=1 Tax=Cylindrotheca closterium TaxID=2856 RepID=A0AAD2G9N5_9STRA|nr:unnamed protein product [Cylindrotheca closterium]